MPRKWRIGIVGCGGIGRTHVNAFQQAGAEIAAVHDVATKAAEAVAATTGARVARSPGEMAARDKLDAVSICTPPAMHLACCLPFLKAQIPVLCEKPLEVDLPHARRLAAAVKKSRTLFMTAFCHRFHPGVIELKKLIQSGVLGKPLFFRNIFVGYLKLKGSHRANPAVSGGGCLIDHCSHSVDLFRYLVGEPTHVQAQGGQIMQKGRIEDFGMIELAAGKNVFGQITASYSIMADRNCIEWFGTKGGAAVRYWQKELPDFAYKIAGKDWAPVDCSAHPDRFLGEVRHFLSCLRTGRTPLITVDDGLQASRIVDSVYRSVRTGRRITL